QVKAQRLARRLDEADDLAPVLRDVDERLLRQRQERGECRAEQRPQARRGRRGFVGMILGGAVKLFDPTEVEQSCRAQLHDAEAMRTNSRCSRRSPDSSGLKQRARIRPCLTATG